MKYYVAYGSNLNLVQMARRCPKSKIFGAGYIPDYELAFHGTEGNAHATILPKKGGSVPALVWMVPPKDEMYLDIYEGFPKYYYKEEVDVIVNGKVVTCMVYLMNQRRVVNLPHPAYVATIRQGYLDNDLDMDYLDEAVQKNQDDVKKTA